MAGSESTPVPCEAKRLHIDGGKTDIGRDKSVGELLPYLSNYFNKSHVIISRPGRTFATVLWVP